MKSMAQQVRELNGILKQKPPREDLTLEITDSLKITDITPPPKVRTKKNNRKPKDTGKD